MNIIMNNFSYLNNPNHIFVIAEAGSNWKCGTYEDDLKQAKQLIDVAFKAGADAVKFQTYRSETVYAKNAGNSNYLSENGINEDIETIFEKHSMPYKMIPELSKYCKKIGIMFMSSAFSVEDAVEIDPYVEIHKIASFEINHIRLLEFLAKTKKPLILSTGASTFEEIDFALNILKKDNAKIVLLQCTSKYPCPLEKLNLSIIPVMKNKYQVPVGFSDHSIYPTIGPCMAIAYGSTIIEKHFTIDKTLPGPDHAFALNPEELTNMIQTIRSISKTNSKEEKIILDVEEELRKFATRSLQAIKNIKKGEILIEGKNFDVLRPGNQKRGLDAKFLDLVNGKKAKKDISIGNGINEFE